MFLHLLLRHFMFFPFGFTFGDVCDMFALKKDNLFYVVVLQCDEFYGEEAWTVDVFAY
jgi:hypothetical protein